MITKNKYFLIEKISIIIFGVSIIFSCLVGSGYFGFGIDYYYAYINKNIHTDVIFDRLGWILSTLTVYQFNFGVHLTSFILSFATGFFIKHFLKITTLNSLLFFLTIYIFSLFSWPVIVSTSNAMRQGLAMSFIFFLLIAIFYKRIIFSLFLMVIILFTHKSGLMFMLILLNLVIFNNFLKKNSNNYFWFGIIIFFFTIIISFNLDTLRYKNNQIIAKDFSPIFLFINICFIIYSTLKYKHLKNNINLFLYFFCFTAIGFYISGLYWQHERYNMIMILPLIFSVGTFFNKNSRTIYLLAAICILFVLTLWTGMYSIGTGIWLKDSL